jgi:hypothetical protein
MGYGALIGLWAPPVAAVDFWLVEAAAAALRRRRYKYHKTRAIIMITIMHMAIGGRFLTSLSAVLSEEET